MHSDLVVLDRDLASRTKRNLSRQRFHFYGCPRCKGTLCYDVKQDPFCLTCGFVKNPNSMAYLRIRDRILAETIAIDKREVKRFTMVNERINVEESTEIRAIYVVPEDIESQRVDIIKSISQIGVGNTLKKYKISLPKWYKIKECWMSQGVIDAATLNSVRGRRGPRSGSFAASVSTIKVTERMISVDKLVALMEEKKAELTTTLESRDWPDEVKTFLSAQLEAYDFIGRQITSLANSSR